MPIYRFRFSDFTLAFVTDHAEIGMWLAGRAAWQLAKTYGTKGGAAAAQGTLYRN